MTAPRPSFTTGPSADDAAAEPAPRFERQGKRPRWVRPLVVVLVLLAALFFGSKFFVKAYKVPSPSMNPTIQEGDRLLMRRGGYSPKVGDVVILHPPEAAVSGFGGEQCEAGTPKRGHSCEVPSTSKPAKAAYVQRIVAGPGDKVKMLDGKILRNGAPTADTAFPGCTNDACSFLTYTVPAGHWLTIGDNRPNSDDGRFWGPISADAIGGPVAVRYWPLGRLGKL